MQPVRSVAQTPATLASTFIGADAGQAGDAVAALRWGLRRYAWVILLCIVALGILLPLQQLNKTPTYTAESLVVANDVQTDLKVLPRFGAAIFDNGQIAAAVIEEFGDAGDPEDVVPQRVSVVTEQDSLIFRVQGHARDAQTAADIANLAATVFNSELNKPGIGVATFEVQSTAIPPVESDEPLRAAPYTVSVGLVAGLVAGLGLLALILVLRRPVVDVGAATRITDLPVFGMVTLPRVSRSGTVQVNEVGGLAPLCRQLLDWSPGAVVITGPSSVGTERHHLARALASALDQVRHVSFTPVPNRSGADGGDDGRYEASGPDTAISVIDGSDSIDLVAPGPRSFVLLVVPVGIRMAELRRLAGELRGVPTAIVLIRTRRRRRRRPASRPSRASGSAEPARASAPLPATYQPPPTYEPIEALPVPPALPAAAEPMPGGSGSTDREVVSRDIHSRDVASSDVHPRHATPVRRDRPVGEESEAADVLEWVAGEYATWFPDSTGPGASLRVARWLTRPRGRIFDLEVRDRDGVTGVIVKVRSLDPALRRRDRWRDRRPMLMPPLGDDPQAVARAEFVGLRSIHESLRQRPSPSLGAVRPFAFNPEMAAIAMEKVSSPSLKEHARSTAWGSPVGLPYMPAIPWVNTGAWLRRYHSAVPAGSLPEYRASRAELIELLQAFGAFLGPRVHHRRLLNKYVDSTCRAAEMFLGEALPTVAAHGDYVAQNVFIAPDGGATAIDPLPRWRAPAFEDLGRLLVGVRLFEPASARPDHHTAHPAPRYNETALLTGYFGAGAVRIGPMRVFLALCTLDRWADTVSKLPHSPVRQQLRASRVAAANRYYRREMRNQLRVMLPDGAGFTESWI